MLGRPVAHSRSPLLHRAAYAALGLTGWTYRAIECDEAALPGLLDGLGPDWAGLSVTMPGKKVALARAELRTDRAVVVGSANTLVRLDDGRWRADCTDIDGVTGALRERGWTAPATGVALVIGAGATAAATVAGLAELGVREVRLVVRDPGRATATREVAHGLGVTTEVLSWDPRLPGVEEADVVVSTVPGGAADDCAPAAARARFVLDVAYHPWPTPMARAVAAAGGRLATGLDMLLHQAFGQVEQFTGRPAPRAAMAAALDRPALDRPGP